MKLNKVFSLDLLYDKAWQKYAAEAGIEDPWRKSRERRNEIQHKEDVVQINGIEVPCINWEFPEEWKPMLPTTEEIDKYRRLEYLWKGEKILPQVGWDEFCNWLDCRKQVKKEDFCPCKSKDGQCSFECAIFGENCDFGK